MPVTFQFVVMTFWGIYAVDRELVYPKHLDALIPQWLNHSMVCFTLISLFCHGVYITLPVT